SLSAPRFSVTSRRPSGRKASAQGSLKLATSVIANTGSTALASFGMGEAAEPAFADAPRLPAPSPLARQLHARAALSASSRKVRCMAAPPFIFTRLYGA